MTMRELAGLLAACGTARRKGRGWSSRFSRRCKSDPAAYCPSDLRCDGLHRTGQRGLRAVHRLLRCCKEFRDLPNAKICLVLCPHRSE